MSQSNEMKEFVKPSSSQQSQHQLLGSADNLISKHDQLNLLNLQRSNAVDIAHGPGICESEKLS